jgi:sulfonate transport system permease protein
MTIVDTKKDDAVSPVLASLVASSGATTRAWTQRAYKSRVRRFVLAFLIPLTITLVWQVSADRGWLDTVLFPAPSEVFWTFMDLSRSGILPYNFAVSFVRASVGFLLGASLGLFFGALVGYSRLSEMMVDPMLQMLRTVPLLAVTPLFILWFGFGELAKILLIAIGAFFPVYVNTFLGVRSVDAKLFEVTRVLQFSSWDQFRRLIFPAAAPNVLLGIRVSIGMSWLCLVVAELMGAQSGLGYMIQNARSLLDTPTVLVGVIIFALIGKGSDSLVRALESRLLGWREGYLG